MKSTSPTTEADRHRKPRFAAPPTHVSSDVAVTVPAPRSLSSWQKILIAADRLESDVGAFTTGALIVAAWRAFPETFGLAGYRERYPDSNRVLSKLMGAIGVRARGWIEEAGVGQFRLSATGRSLAVTAGALLRPTG